jgi:ribosomal protein S18 acetylase RimI-like enzyme
VNNKSSEQAPAPSTITLRPVGPDDNDFLLELYASTRAEELAMVPWTSEQRQAFVRMQFTAQQTEYQQMFPEATHEVILLSARPVGQLHVARLETEIRIIDITIMPLQRNGGIGTFLLRELLSEAARMGLVVRIYIESYNPSLRLFERLGFRKIEQQGIHLLLEGSQGVG